MAAFPFFANAIDVGGGPASGARLQSYIQNTTTPLGLWLDSGLSIPATNPVIADADGRFEIYADSTKAYTWQIRTSDQAVVLWEANVSGGIISVTYTNGVVIESSWAPPLASPIGARQGTLLAADAAKDAGGVKAALFGLLSAGATALATINSVLSHIGLDRRDVDLSGETVQLSAAPTNTYGTRFKRGKLLIPSGIGAYTTQQNTYADDVNGIMVARENLAAWWKSVTAGTLQSIYLYGDSTVETGGAFSVKPQDLFKFALYSAGVNNCLTVNRGLSGTSWSDLSALTDLASTTKLIVIKYGINDAVKSNALATMMADARSKLTAIRADTDGGFSNLSILLMGPNSTFRPETGQDAKWFEDVRNCYLQLCKEFDCAYFDTYAYLQQTKNAPGLWMDSFDGGQGLHPDPVAVYWIWYEGIKTFVLGDGNWNVAKANRHWNISHATAQVSGATSPQDFPNGLSVWGGLTSDSFPVDGPVYVYGHADGTRIQEQWTLDTQPRRIMRTGAGAVWTQWVGARTAVSVFTNGWSNKGGGYAEAGYVLLENGMVALYGVVTGGAIASSVFTLPSNLRPSAVHMFSDANGSNITVWPDGTVVAANGTTTTISLDGVMFPAVNP